MKSLSPQAMHLAANSTSGAMAFGTPKPCKRSPTHKKLTNLGAMAFGTPKSM